MPDDMRVSHDEARQRYEIATPDGVAIAAYRPQGDVVEFLHTEVPDALQGQGIGGRLVAGALADVRKRGLKVKPSCAFVRHYIDQHPELADLVADF